MVAVETLFDPALNPTNSRSEEEKAISRSPWLAKVFAISWSTLAGMRISLSEAAPCQGRDLTATRNLSVATMVNSFAEEVIITAVRTGVTSSLDAATATWATECAKSEAETLLPPVGIAGTSG